MTTETLERTSELTALDRCDHRNCAAQARVRLVFELEETFSLDFCLHHFRTIEEAATESATTIIDERETVT